MHRSPEELRDKIARCQDISGAHCPRFWTNDTVSFLIYAKRDMTMLLDALGRANSLIEYLKNEVEDLENRNDA